MPSLTLTIRWLGGPEGVGSYHGGEWPPSPSRLFRALLAGCCRPGGIGRRGIEALERLERQSAPVILGPAPERLVPVAAAVPNNDGDRIFDQHHKGLPGKARQTASKLKTIRARQGWCVQGPVQYRWHFPHPDPDPGAFEQLAEGLSILGQGTDLAWADADWTETDAPQWGFAWIPDELSGEEAMAVPAPGEVERLGRKYESDRNRIEGPYVASTREPARQMARYRDPLAPPAFRWQAFMLRTTDDTSALALPGEQAMRVSGMVRHAIAGAAKRAGLDGDTFSAIMGHGGSARISVLPLPNAGHQWADGRIRRVIVRAPLMLEEEIWSQVVRRLTAAELVDEQGQKTHGILVPIARPKDDRVLWRFIEPATIWTSVTPVVLPGFDKRGGRGRPAKMTRRLLNQAQIPAQAVRHVRFDHAPGLMGMVQARALEVPHYLERYPIKFVTIEFHRPVRGPLMLGAGKGVGLGVLMQMPESRKGPANAAIADAADPPE